MPPLLLLLTFLLPPEAGTGDHLGGHEAKPHSRPYMAFVSFLVGKKRKRCDGVLVQEEFVLTAAHCKGSSVKVTLGAHNIKKPEKTQQVTFVTKAIAHPDYDCNTLFNDIMLLQLKREAKLTKAVQPLRLHENMAQVNPGDKCLVAGWGKMSPLGTLASKLQEVELTVQDELKCKSVFRAFSYITEICMGDPRKTKCSFKGDSGAPLVCNNMVQGIFSGGKEHGRPPGVFTKVSHFLPWVKSTTKHF
ncbi:Granzyme H [Heterocephalus glaber]|uniref:Granzyme H n=1 Tax=Heterocephalus glaber TaxID=10181 RepID=G5BRP4_HETGA|nr:granzyme H isoform X3 [Heterocephalus glaber]EHB11955.1 Granzyme H [Heterocephalus glaber]